MDNTYIINTALTRPTVSFGSGGKGTASDFHSTGLKNSNRPGRGGFPVMYHSYLQLDKILGAHECMSQRRTNKDTGEIESPGFGENGEAAHDEHLFITIHQAYELWFKQMMFEIDDVLRMFSQEHVPESCIGHEYPTEFYCPISHCLMLEPMMDREGNTYDRTSIEQWLSKHNTSPITRNSLNANK